MEPEMAEEDDQKPEELSLSAQLLAEEEQDVLFKTQMAIANFFLGYWKHMLGVLGVGLLGVLVYGFWSDYTRSQQQEIHQKVAEVESQLPKELRYQHEIGFPIIPGDDDPEGASKLTTAGGEIQALADASDGAGATYARLRAASLWEAGGRPDISSTILEQAAVDDVDGILSWSAKARLAASKAAGGDVDGAAAIYQSISSESEDAISQEAMYRLGQLYHDAGRNDEAVSVWQGYISAYPADTTRVAQLSKIISELQTAG
jgi:tetratricopeptide (TPR) repeat protein